MVRGWSIVPGGLDCQIPTGLFIQSQKQVVMRVGKVVSRVTILRDSAADISLVLKEAVPNPDCYTGEMEYDEPFSEVARLCPLLDHNAETRDVQPVLQFPCPLDVMNGASLQAEVRRRREQGFICPCLGPLASAAVLVLESSGLHPRVDCRRARTDAWAVRLRSVG
nr:uncharacterized protein LOC113830493 [Penaeus vannamei]